MIIVILNNSRKILFAHFANCCSRLFISLYDRLLEAPDKSNVHFFSEMRIFFGTYLHICITNIYGTVHCIEGFCSQPFIFDFLSVLVPDFHLNLELVPFKKRVNFSF